jgi:hypothetical protein
LLKFLIKERVVDTNMKNWRSTDFRKRERERKEKKGRKELLGVQQ